jgi:hypothetical protein
LTGRGTGWKDRNVIVSLMVICAVLASMALGVLVAYGICMTLFRLLGARAMAAPARQSKTAEAKA